MAHVPLDARALKLALQGGVNAWVQQQQQQQQQQQTCAAIASMAGLMSRPTQDRPASVITSPLKPAPMALNNCNTNSNTTNGP